jgi:hypothetical protein
MNEKAKIIFNKVYKQQMNFITPEAVDFLDLGNGLYVELSQGEGEDHSMKYGVMVVQANGEDLIKRDDLDRLFDSHKEALNYIRKLERGEEE